MKPNRAKHQQVRCRSPTQWVMLEEVDIDDAEQKFSRNEYDG
jgi:hypothetical protein